MSYSLPKPWTAAHQASLLFIISQSLPKFMFIESVILSNHFIFCCPLLFLPSVFLSIRVFSNKSVLCIRWPKYCSFSFSIIGISELKTMLLFKYHVITFYVWRSKITCMCNRQKDIYIVNTLSFFACHFLKGEGERERKKWREADIGERENMKSVTIPNCV